MYKSGWVLLLFLSLAGGVWGQPVERGFRIRTITAGVTMRGLEDTATIKEAIVFLKAAKEWYVGQGYTVQTLRIATSNLPGWLGGRSLTEALPFLRRLDVLVTASGMILSVGQVLTPDRYDPGIGDWAGRLVRETRSISFSIGISSHALGVHYNSIRAAAEVVVALSKEENGEANFRFTASANCPAGIPFFPAAFHEGGNSFAVGLESANLLTAVFERADRSNVRAMLKRAMEQALRPVQEIGEGIAAGGVGGLGGSPGAAAGVAGFAGVGGKWQFDGIDASPAPGLDASIGKAIETYTKQPFGSPSTLGACAMIKDVLKGLDIKRCGYSGLMLPVIEDSVLARRAAEGRYTMEELLLFSSVSGTGLDVVPLPGNISKETIGSILTDVAALSLKYTAKALSARLFPIPGKKEGDRVTFKNEHLTGTVVMRAE